MGSIPYSGISHFYPVTELIWNSQSRAEPKIVSKLNLPALHPNVVIHWLLHKEKCILCLKMQVASAAPYATWGFFCVCGLVLIKFLGPSEDCESDAQLKAVAGT